MRLLGVTAASNENVARIGQTLTQNKPYRGRFDSTTLQQLLTQTISMAPAISIVQPQGVAPPTVTYQAAQPLGAAQSRWIPYQTGMWPMWQNIGQQSNAYSGNFFATPTTVRPATGWGQERSAGPSVGTGSGTDRPLRAATSPNAADDSGTAGRARQESRGQERWRTGPSARTASTTGRLLQAAISSNTAGGSGTLGQARRKGWGQE